MKLNLIGVRELVLRKRSSLRKHAPNAIFVLSATTVGLAGTFANSASMKSIVYLALGWGALAGCLTVKAHLNSLRVARQFGNKIRGFVYVPTPIGSMVESLNSQNVATSDLINISLMSSDLQESITYYKEGDYEGVSLLRIMDANPDLTATIYGPSKTPAIKSPHDRMSLVVTPVKLTEHKNLIDTKRGQSFVWYEPYHEVFRGDQYFTHGAYLIEIDKKLKAEIQKEYGLLSRSRPSYDTIDAGVLSTEQGATDSAQVGASLAPDKGGMMRIHTHSPSEDVGFAVFKAAILITTVGLICRLLLLALNQMPLALVASAVAAIGGNLFMLSVLGNRNGKKAEHDRQA